MRREVKINFEFIADPIQACHAWQGLTESVFQPIWLHTASAKQSSSDKTEPDSNNSKESMFKQDIIPFNRIKCSKSIFSCLSLTSCFFWRGVLKKVWAQKTPPNLSGTFTHGLLDHWSLCGVQPSPTSTLQASHLHCVNSAVLYGDFALSFDTIDSDPEPLNWLALEGFWVFGIYI